MARAQRIHIYRVPTATGTASGAAPAPVPTVQQVRQVRRNTRARVRAERSCGSCKNWSKQQKYEFILKQKGLMFLCLLVGPTRWESAERSRSPHPTELCPVPRSL